MTQYYVYMHFKPNGELFYIGKGKGIRAHVFNSGRCLYHRNIVAKYGKENIEILKFYRDSEKEALDTEVQWIKIARESGYELVNISSGGESPQHSKETRDRIKKSNTGKKRSLEVKAKMSESKLKLYKDRPELRDRLVLQIREAHKLVDQNKRIAAVKVAQAEYRKNPEFVAKNLAQLREATKNSWESKFTNPEAYVIRCAKISQTKLQPLECPQLNCVFDCCKDASESLGISTGSIYKVLAGARKSVKNLTFSYI